MGLWLDAIAKHIPPNEIITILDVGCGTGRFAAGLANTFDANVIGFEPSLTMLSEAERNVVHPRVTFCNADAQRLPVNDQSACMVFLSMVYHHIEDPDLAAREFHRVLRPGGFVCIRNSTRDLLDRVPYLKYFPIGAEFNRRRLPSQHDVIVTMQNGNLSLQEHQVIEQVLADSAGEYRDKICRRALSDLAALSDAEFDAGVLRMSEAVDRNELSEPIIEPIDLFIFNRHCPDTYL
jgi:SAM-dependent methyltransferase